METKTNNENFLGKEVVYNESFWTGTKSLMIDNTVCKKQDKNTFTYQTNNETKKIKINGNYFTGISLNMENNHLQLVPKTKWYEYLLSIMIFALILIWGNSISLNKIFIVIGGAIGGLISGIFTISNIIIIKRIDNIFLKILISIGFLAITFFICHFIGLAFVSALTK